jgi:hypothetical protein
MQPAVTTAQTRFHQYRISVIETWPEDATRQSALAAARAALNRELTYERETAAAESRDLSSEK